MTSMKWKTFWVLKCVEMAMIAEDIEIVTRMDSVKEKMDVNNLSVNGLPLILLLKIGSAT